MFSCMMSFVPLCFATASVVLGLCPSNGILKIMVYLWRTKPHTKSSMKEEGFFYKHFVHVKVNKLHLEQLYISQTLVTFNKHRCIIKSYKMADASKVIAGLD